MDGTRTETPHPDVAETDAVAWVQDCVRDRPDLAVLASVAAGAAVGYAISSLFDQPKPSASRRAENLANSIGRRFMETFDDLGRTGFAGVRDRFTG